MINSTDVVPMRRRRHATTWTAAGVAAPLLAALLVGCGGGPAPEPADRGSSPRPASAEQQSTSAEPDTAYEPNVQVESDRLPRDDIEVQPEPTDEHADEVASPYDTAAPELDPAEGESDADAFVDRDLEKVIGKVHDNNMDSTNVWSP